MSDIPISIGTLDGAWLGRALHDAGHDHPGIADIAVKPMPGIVGALGEVGVVEVEYDSALLAAAFVCGQVSARLRSGSPLQPDHDAVHPGVGLLPRPRA